MNALKCFDECERERNRRWGDYNFLHNGGLGLSDDLCIRRLLPKYISRAGFIPTASGFSLECRVRNTNPWIFKESSFRSHERRSSLAETAVNRPRVRENYVIPAIFVNTRFRIHCVI